MRPFCSWCGFIEQVLFTIKISKILNFLCLPIFLLVYVYLLLFVPTIGISSPTNQFNLVLWPAVVVNGEFKVIINNRKNRTNVTTGLQWYVVLVFVRQNKTRVSRQIFWNLSVNHIKVPDVNDQNKDYMCVGYYTPSATDDSRKICE